MSDAPKKPGPTTETRIHPAGSNEELTTPTPDQELIYNPGHSDHGRPKNNPNPDAPHAGSMDNPGEGEPYDSVPGPEQGPA
jgi:hypothetical protein